MQKSKLKIKENVMEQIHDEKITMKPRSYFFIGSTLTLIGLVASVIVSVFLISLVSFMLRPHGPMGDYRLNLMIESFPWWILILAIGGIGAGIFMLKKYDFSYKANFWLIILGFLIAVIIGGILVDLTGLNNIWLKRGPLNSVMRNYYKDGSFERSFKKNESGLHNGQGRGRNRR